MTSPGWHPDHPYNALPLLPPSQEIETRAVLKRCITARAALAELKQATELIPNQDMLINTLPLLEAKDSSGIENIVTSTDKLFQFAQSDHLADLATKEALRRVQEHGHKAIAIVGGGTGLIGDPSGKANERTLNTPETVAAFVKRRTRA